MSRLNNLKFGDVVAATSRVRPFIGLLLAILLVTVVLPLKPKASQTIGSRGPVFGDEQQQEALVPTSETTEVPPEAFVGPEAYSPDQFSTAFYEELSSDDDLEDGSSSGGDDLEEEEEEEEEEPEPEPEPSPLACVPGVACLTPSG